MPKPALRPSADRILAAAEALFAKHGYANVSLRQLIAAAKVSTTAFYARFASKEAVLDAMIERLFQEIYREALPRFRAARDLDDGIARGVDLLCELLGPRKQVVRLALAESGGNAASTAARSRSYALLAHMLAGRFAALAERRRIVAPDPLALAWALVGALDIHIVRWAVWDELSPGELRTQLEAAARAVVPEERS